MPPPIIPAATVVIVSEIDDQINVLLLQRNASLAFAGNTWVFPGGKVEQFEIDSVSGDTYAASCVAACRETEEETGLIIESNQLTPISHWTTPELHARRFATQFFIARVAPESQVIVDQSEIVDFQWISAELAIEKHERGNLTMMPPTLVTLAEIAGHQKLHELHRFYQSRSEPKYTPRVTLTGKSTGVFLYDGDSGYADNNPNLTENLNRCEMRDGIIRHQNTIHRRL